MLTFLFDFIWSIYHYSRAMLNLFDQSLPYGYSFNEKHTDIRQWFRESIIGGLSSVYHRHIDLMGTDSPIAARTVPNGDPATHAQFVDFNS